MSFPACPICREQHEPRGLSFDGKGINSCGIYRARLATFVVNADLTAQLGPLFAAAPEFLAALEQIAELEGDAEQQRFRLTRFQCSQIARAAIHTMKGGAQ